MEKFRGFKKKSCCGKCIVLSVLFSVINANETQSTVTAARIYSNNIHPPHFESKQLKSILKNTSSNNEFSEGRGKGRGRGYIPPMVSPTSPVVDSLASGYGPITLINPILNPNAIEFMPSKAAIDAVAVNMVTINNPG